MAFIDLTNQLVGEMGGTLSPFLADTHVSQAWREIQAERQWSFLQADGAVVCPAQVTAGSVSITQYSATVTCNATASAALLAIGATTSSDAFTPPALTNMQIRFGGTGNASFSGQIYNIASVDDSVPTAVVLTLDRVVVQPTNATSGYQCYRCYVKPPVDDFLSWQSFVDMTNGWALRLNLTATYFDRMDPQRQSQGQAYAVGSFLGNPELQPRPQYELWPAPTSGQTFYVRYRRMGSVFLNQTDSQPPIIPDSLILHRARGWYTYPWAAANVGRQPTLRGVGWVSMTMDAKKMYSEELQKTKMQDNQQEQTSVWNTGHGLRRGNGFDYKGMTGLVIDATWLSSHLVPF